MISLQLQLQQQQQQLLVQQHRMQQQKQLEHLKSLQEMVHNIQILKQQLMQSS